MASKIPVYEEVRRRMLEENKKKLDGLNLSHLALSLREATGPKTPSAKQVKRKAPGEEFTVVKRRSDRIANLPEQGHSEAAKDLNMPKRPPSAFFVFKEGFRKEFKKKNPSNKSAAAVAKASGERWKSMSDSDKAPYVAKAEKLKAEYDKKISAYNKEEKVLDDNVEEEAETSDKDLNKPKRPPSAFFVFMEGFRKEFKEKNPSNKSVAVVGKASGERWKSMSDSDKAPYVAKAEELKAEYYKKISAYNKGEKVPDDSVEEEAETSDKSKSEVEDQESRSEEEGEDDD